MQVSQVADHITHAVITGNKARSMSMSDDAEFYGMLSNALYSRKKEAMVREILCNAWDSHIASGKTTVPLSVSLADNRFVIRDFGAGIPDELIVPIYGTYGKSTKLHDGKQTGGFGLGSKAPYAYAEHFEVISWHAGTKTIYRMSKSLAECDGKPGILVIAKLPCGDETGVQVTVEIKPGDHVELENLVKQIAANGEMNVSLTSSVWGRRTVEPAIVPTMPFSTAEQGFLVSQENLLGTSFAKLMVRYGNVIYPIEEVDAFKGEYRRVLKVLEDTGSHRHYRITFQAAPNSISVTPSRESLSMTERTIDTLRELMVNFLDQYADHLDRTLATLAEQLVLKAWTAFRPAELLKTDHSLVGWRSDWDYNDRSPGKPQLPNYMVTFEQLSTAYAYARYPTTNNFRKRDITLRVSTLLEAGYGGPTNRGKLQSFLAEYRQGRAIGNWLHQRILGPITTAVKAHPELSETRLLVCTATDNSETRRRKLERYDYGNVNFIETTKFPALNALEDGLPFLRNFIILAFNRNDVQERTEKFPVMRHWLGSWKESLVYVVQRSDDKARIAREFFQSKGYTVVDLTVRQPWEPAVIKEPKIRAPKKVRPEGIPLVSTLLDPVSGLVKTQRFRDDALVGKDRTSEPEYLVKISAREEKDYFDAHRFSSQVTRDFVHLYGQYGAVVVSESQADKYRPADNTNQGREYLPWLLDRMLADLKSNPALMGHFARTPERLNITSQDKSQIYKAVLDDPILRKHFGIAGTPLTQNDKRFLRLYQYIDDRHGRFYTTQVGAIKAQLRTEPVDPTASKFVAMLNASKLLPVLDTRQVRILLRTVGPATEDRRTRLRGVLTSIIEG